MNAIKKEVRNARILMAEDDDDDYLLARIAFEKSELPVTVSRVADGEELLQYLRQEGSYVGALKPDLILLDLNMPKKDGREALAEIKESSQLRKIPVVILTTSQSQEDVIKTHDIGCNSFIVKPVTTEDFIEVAKSLSQYWFDVVSLPE